MNVSYQVDDTISERRGMTMRVLIIDDQPRFLEATAAMLMFIPYIESVCCAQGGREGLKLALEMHPTVVLTDFSMPDLDGAALTRLLKAMPRTPYVVMTSFHAEPEYAEMAFKAGADVYLVKSDVVTELVPLLKRLKARPLGQEAGN